MLSRQEIFDKVAAHLLAQGRKSLATAGDGLTICAYRGEDGAKCAVGCLIDDAVYDRRMEGQSSDSIIVHEALRKSGVRVEPYLLRCLQAMHDDYEPNEWGSRLKAVARKNGVEYAI